MLGLWKHPLYRISWNQLGADVLPIRICGGQPLASEVMKDVCTQLLGISAIVAIVTVAVVLVMVNASHSGRTVDEFRA